MGTAKNINRPSVLQLLHKLPVQNDRIGKSGGRRGDAEHPATILDPPWE
jgi:hypothetical protein